MPETGIVELLNDAIFFCSTMAGAVLWYQTFRRWGGDRQTALVDRSVRAGWGLVDVLIVAFAWLSCPALLSPVFLSLADVAPGRSFSAMQAATFGLVTGAAQVLVVSVAFILICKRYRHTASDFRLNPRQWGKGIRWGMMCFVMWVPLVWVIQTILIRFVKYKHPSLDQLSTSTTLTPMIMVWVNAVMFAPILEEILFRGIIQGWLQRFRGPNLREPDVLIIGGLPRNIEEDTEKDGIVQSVSLHIPAILFTSLLFGLVHLSQGPAPISLFVLSVGLGVLYQISGSLLACVVVHMMLNGVTMTVFLIGQLLK